MLIWTVLANVNDLLEKIQHVAAEETGEKYDYFSEHDRWTRKEKSKKHMKI